jgi:hypothetical protein
VFPFLGSEIIEWLFPRCAQLGNGLDQERLAFQLTLHSTDNKTTGEQMKSGSVQARADRAPEALIEVAANNEDVVLSALTQLKSGKIEDAVADFAENFFFKDRGLGLELTDRERLREFFQKKRESYPGSSFQAEKILVAEDYVIAKWLIKYTIKEPFYGSVLRNVVVPLHGVLVISTRMGKIIERSDYYDGLSSRRTALTSYFTDWTEY